MNILTSIFSGKRSVIHSINTALLLWGATAAAQQSAVDPYVGKVVGLSAVRNSGPLFSLNKQGNYDYPAADWGFNVCAKAPALEISNCGGCYDVSDAEQRKLEKSFRTGQEVKITFTGPDKPFGIASVELLGDEIVEQTKNWFIPDVSMDTPMIGKVALSDEQIEHVRHNGLDARVDSVNFGDDVSPYRIQVAVDYDFDGTVDLRLVGCLKIDDKHCTKGTTLSISQSWLLVNLALREPQVLPVGGKEIAVMNKPRVRIYLDYLESFNTETPKIREISYQKGM